MLPLGGNEVWGTDEVALNGLNGDVVLYVVKCILCVSSSEALYCFRSFIINIELTMSDNSETKLTFTFSQNYLNFLYRA